MKRMFDINKPPPHPYWCDDCGEKAPFTIPHTPIPHRKGCSRFNNSNRLCKNDTRLVDGKLSRMLGSDVFDGADLSIRAMPYRIRIGDAQVEVDTPEEVYAFLKYDPSEKTAEIGALPPSDKRRWTPDTVRQFMDAIKSQGQQRRLLRTLYYGHPDGMSKEELACELNMGLKQLGGTLSGITKNLKRFPFGPIFDLQRARIKGQRTARYRMTKNFRECIDNLNVRRPNLNGEAGRFEA